MSCAVRQILDQKVDKSRVIGLCRADEVIYTEGGSLEIASGDVQVLNFSRKTRLGPSTQKQDFTCNSDGTARPPNLLCQFAVRLEQSAEPACFLRNL